MNTALNARTNAVFAYSDALTDFSLSNGLLVSSAAGALTVSASATVPAVAICLDGQGVNKQSNLQVLGCGAPVRMVADGVINAYDRVIQHNNGKVLTDSGPGNARVIVGVALEAAVAGDYFIVAPIAPVIGS